MKDPRRIPFIPGKPGAEVDSELSFHIEERIQANSAVGMNPDDARRAAVERFGEVAGVREECARLLTAERKTQSRRDWFDDFFFQAEDGIRDLTVTGVQTCALPI